LAKELLARAQCDKAYQWDLTNLYASDEAWDKAWKNTMEKALKLADFSGKLTESAQTLFEAYELSTEVMQELSRLFSYAHMHLDEDNTNTTYQAMKDRAMMLYVKASEVSAFMDPQLLAAPDGVVEGYLKEYAPLAPYKFTIERTLRQKPHTLSEKEERLLAMAGEVMSAPDTIYSMLCDADMQFPVIKDENGEDVQISHGRYGLLLENKDRRVRKDAFDGLYSSYKAMANTIAATFSANVKAEALASNARNYPSALESELFGNNIPVSVYESLLEAMHKGTEIFDEYLKLRKELLGVDELHHYDLYVPLFEYEGRVTYEEAIENIKKGLAPLGETYLADAAHAFTDGWVDVYENKGKTSGAYSTSVYGEHPYILLNYQDSLDSMFTLAHELGHAMHSFYSDKNNTFLGAQYPIFLAEVASTTNELLLNRYRIANASSKEEKQYLLGYLLEQFRTTMYRQSMFAEFEYKVHKAAQEGQSLTGEFLNGIYAQLNRDYYPSVHPDENIAYEWSRIPHFYSPFYVYQYATGFAAAVKLSDDLYNGVPGAQERYLRFLSAGGHKYPIDILKDAGLDMTGPEVVAQAMDFLRQVLEQLRETL